MRILVVEDQKDLNEIIVRKLTSEHYTVDACYSGDEALDFLRCAEYDGVILDIMLPGITGLGAVSYTHLDVYKRQRKRRAFSWPE